MLKSETLIVALDALRANKVKAFLTMLGVVIGSACIVLVVTVALTGKKYILTIIEGVGSNLVYAEVLRSGPPQTAVQGDEITPGDLQAVRQSIPQVTEAAGSRDLSLSVIVDGIERSVTVVGITDGFQRIRNLVITRGRFLDEDDLAARSKVTAITDELATRAFPNDDPIGQMLRVGELHLTVIGVFKERVSTFGLSEIQGESALIPLQLLKYYTGNDDLRVLYAQAERADFQAVHVVAAFELAAEPAAHAHPGIAAHERLDAERRVKLVPQRLATAGIDPGDVLVRNEPERHRGEERRRRLLALPVERRRMPHLGDAAADRVEHLEGRHQLARRMHRDVDPPAR